MDFKKFTFILGDHQVFRNKRKETPEWRAFYSIDDDAQHFRANGHESRFITHQRLMDSLITEQYSLITIIHCHHEYMIRRCCRRIAEGIVLLSDVAVYYYEVGKEPRLLELDQYGNFLDLPEGMLYDDSDDISAQALAEIKRKQESGIAEEIQLEENSELVDKVSTQPQDEQIEALCKALYECRASRGAEYANGNDLREKRIAMHEQIGEMWTLLLRARDVGGDVSKHPLDGSDACLMMVGMKLLRRMGSQDHADSLLDLINYALIGDACRKEQ